MNLNSIRIHIRKKAGIQNVRVARLQNEVGTKYFFRGTKCLTENAPKFPPKCLSHYFVGQKNPAKFPPNFPTKFPPKNQKEITDELLQERREKKMCLLGERLRGNTIRGNRPERF